MVPKLESHTIVYRKKYITQSLNLPTTLEDIKAIDTVLEFKHDMNNIARGLEFKKWLMELWYNMENHKV